MTLDDIPFVDERVRLVAEEANTICGKAHFRSFASAYLKDKWINDIDWDRFCKEASNHKHNNDGWIKALSTTIYISLKHGLYCGSHKKALEELLPKLIFIENPKFHRHERFLCGPNIDYMMVVTFHYGNRSYSFPFYFGTNKFVRSILNDALNSEYRNFWRRITYEIIADFEKSLGEYADRIEDVSDFSEMTYLTQANYFKQKYKDNEKLRHNSVIALTDFYRYLCFMFPNANLFGKNSTISHLLLSRPPIHRLVLEGYRFCRLNPFDDFGEDKKYCFIMTGPYSRSTRIVDEGYVIIDISVVSNPMYRRLIIQYLQSIQRPFRHEFYYIAQALSVLERIKALPGYLNNDLLYVDNMESSAIISFFTKTGSDTKGMDSLDNMSPSAGLHISYTRSFFIWCDESGRIKFEDGFFKNFKPPKYQYYKGGNPAGTQDIGMLAECLKKKSAESLKYHLIYIVFLLLLQTEMRVNHILSAKVNSFKETFKMNQYALIGVTKTSHGEEVETHLAPQTMSLFQQAIQLTHNVRENCKIEAIKEHVFIYNSTKTKTQVLSSHIFYQELKNSCNELNIDRTISSKVLRDTHATNADNFVRKTNRPQTQLTQLTGHSSVSMTEKHYLRYDLAEMLEAAYGVSFVSDYENFSEHVIDEDLVADELSQTVQDGCGVCNAETCTNTCIPLCPVCKHFVTTVKHLPFFKKAIEDLDNRISKARNRHDIEDLVSLKEVYVKYLSVIYEKIETDASH